MSCHICNSRYDAFRAETERLRQKYKELRESGAFTCCNQSFLDLVDFIRHKNGHVTKSENGQP